MSRGGFKITRVVDAHGDVESGDRINWLDTFARKLEQVSKQPSTAVEAARMRDNKSIIDQIHAIVSKQPRHSSVEAVVQDYQDKVGLKEWLRMSADNLSNIKTAEDLPDNFEKFAPAVREDIKNFIRNKIDTHHGNIQVPAMVEEVMQTFRSKGVSAQDVNDTRFEKYISDEILRSKKRTPATDEHNANLGRGVGLDVNDGGNADVFEGLNPVKQL